MMPHILCPGCGHGIVLKAILRAVHRLGLRREDVIFVLGIGCSSRIIGYVDFCTLQTTHGRPLTFASGIKLAPPDLHVIVITGDGDGLAIGGNHLIHAARRNIDLTCLLLNNAIYGMTGGQGAPTTPEGARSSISPSGAVEPAFDACRLAEGAGASYVARGLTATPLELDDLIGRAIAHRGFAFVRILQRCPIWTPAIFQEAAQDPRKTPVRPAARDVFLASEVHGAVAAVAGVHRNPRFIDELHLRQPCSGKVGECRLRRSRKQKSPTARIGLRGGIGNSGGGGDHAHDLLCCRPS